MTPSGRQMADSRVDITPETVVGDPMNLRAVGPVTGLVGGLCWIARWGADLAGSSPSSGTTTRWVGLVLLLVALAAAGTGLVGRGVTWLRVLVAVALPLLVWSVYEVVRGDGGGVALDGLLGVVALTCSVVALLSRSPAAPTARAGRSGSHAAR